MASNWHYQRLKVIQAQGGKCHNYDATGCLKAARDVIPVDGVYHGYCAACRLKLDAKTRIPRAVYTKKELRKQVTIDQYLSKSDERR